MVAPSELWRLINAVQLGARGIMNPDQLQVVPGIICGLDVFAVCLLASEIA